MRYARIIPIGIAAVVLVLAGALITGYARFNGVGDLLLIPDPAMLRPRTYSILNPLRNRGPERAAENLLNALNAHGPEVLVPLLGTSRPDDLQHILDREQRYPIRSWRLGDRQVRGDAVDLTYWAARGGTYASDLEEETYISVRRVGSEWMVTDYSAIY